MEFIDIISSVGFPIGACLALGAYITQKDKSTAEDNRQDKEMLMEEIKYNREVNASLLETNKLLAKDLKQDLMDIKQGIKSLDKSS